MRAFGWTVLAVAAGLAAAVPASKPGLMPPPAPAPPPPPVIYPPQRTLDLGENATIPKECATSRKPGSPGYVMCLPKCCPPGMVLNQKDCIPEKAYFNPFVRNYPYTTNGEDLVNKSVEDYYLVIGNPCKQWWRVSYKDIDLWESGELVVYYSSNSDESEIYKIGHYCLEYSDENDTEAIICDTETDTVYTGFTSLLYTSGMTVSVLGLLLTLVVYLAVDALRDLHGKSLVCHVGCLAIAYCLLVHVQLKGYSGFGPDVCRRVAFAIQFFLLSSFMWLHVMCLDAFWCVLEATGRSPIPYPRAKKWVYDDRKKQWVTGINEVDLDEAREQERKQRDKMVERRVFVGYSIYAWTLSIVPVLAVTFHKLSPTIPATYVDLNMLIYCNSNNDRNEESFWYFYPFTATFMAFNVIIFICICIIAMRFKWNITGPQRVPKQKARMCFLLFALMSSNWIIDIISWALGGKQIVWVMLHAFYILQGLITFLIFVLEDRVKDRIIHKLWPCVCRIHKKYGCCHRGKVEEEVALRSCNATTSAQHMGWINPDK